MSVRIRFGDSDVARVGLGTNRLRNTAANVAFLKAAVAAGIELIDTARLYTGGESEAAVGSALAGAAGRCVIATKGGFGGAGRGRPEVLHAEIEESLRRLRTDTIQVYYLHRVDPETPIEVSLAAIKEYRDRGSIRHVGISAVSIEQVERARNVVPIAAVQNHYNLSERKHDGVVDYCARDGIPFVPYFPLGGRPGPVLDEIARRHRVTPAQVTLAWLLRRSPTMLPIPGTLSLDHVNENLAAMEIELSDAEFRALQ